MSIKMQAPKGHGGISVGGAQYKPDKSGQFDVDAAHVEEAKIHGMKVVGDGDDSDEDTGRKSSRKEGDVDYSKMNKAELAERFKERFHFDPGGASKGDLVDALEKGWKVFNVDELKEAYAKRFGNAPDAALKKDDLIEALDQPV